MNRPIVLLWTIVLIVYLLLSGCTGEPYTYKSDHELKPGPGLFSGKDGEFTIISSPEKKKVQKGKRIE